MPKLFTTAIAVFILLALANIADCLLVNHDWKSTGDILAGAFAGILCLTLVLSRAKER